MSWTLLAVCIVFLFRLSFFRNLQDYRILVCGGDGTVGWILDAIGEIFKSMHSKRDVLAFTPCNSVTYIISFLFSCTQTKPICWYGHLSLCFLLAQEMTLRVVSDGEEVRNKWEKKSFCNSFKSLNHMLCAFVLQQRDVWQMLDSIFAQWVIAGFLCVTLS